MLAGHQFISRHEDNEYPDMLQVALTNLNATVFFGITDYWNTTVCLFHRELNGPGPRPSEFINTRKNELKAGLGPKEDALLRRTLKYDNALYDEAFRQFKARAERYGCPLGTDAAPDVEDY